MEKRKLIDQVEVDKILSSTNAGNDELMGVYEDILNIKPVSEQEIIRPYLDKLKTDIMKLTDDKTPERIWNVDVIELIDNLIAEMK